MKSVNKVTLLGNVTHDPELKSIAGGTTVCTFDLATNRTWKDKAGETQSVPEFHHMVAWRGLGEFCGKYLKKGKPLFVEGYLKTGSWEKDGVKHSRTEVVAENIVLLGAKDKSPEAVEEAEPVVA